MWSWIIRYATPVVCIAATLSDETPTSDGVINQEADEPCRSIWPWKERCSNGELAVAALHSPPQNKKLTAGKVPAFFYPDKQLLVINMRELTEHKVNPANDILKIEVVDEPGQGGANHLYRVTGFDTTSNHSDHLKDVLGPMSALCIFFQNGPINEYGVNGITHEVLLAILADRLRGFQDGPFACFENRQALAHIEAAQELLHSRTRTRMERGVEGTHTV